jgi:hypothetical protein
MKTFTKVSSFCKESFAKTKSDFRENFCEKMKAKTFVPTLIFISCTYKMSINKTSNHKQSKTKR